MNRNGHKIQLTVRLDPATHAAARALERKTRRPLSVIVAEAARDTLIPEERASLFDQLESVSNRLLQRTSTLERSIGRELTTIKELIAVGSRVYLNHVPEVPESERETASLSGRARFAKLVASVKRNLDHGVSILDETEGYHGDEQ